jgi:hypothetical protein
MKRKQPLLDSESQRLLDDLVRRLGWSSSRVMREGLLLLSACYGKPSRSRVVGLGRFASGVTNLGSGKKHFEGFGRKEPADSTKMA